MPNPDYRKMFDDLESFYPETSDLLDLALLMSGSAPSVDPGLIPAGYTYFAQFIGHDISFEEDSDRFVSRDRPSKIIDPELIKQIRNLRKPNFDLEILYGYENPTNRGEPSRDELLLFQDPNFPRLPLLNLGYTNGADDGTAKVAYPSDLPRGVASIDAKIVDSRNDENLLLAQTQVAFMKFHNAIVMWLRESYKNVPQGYTIRELFAKARKLTIRYYQTIILTDFLPRVAQESVIKENLPEIRTRTSYYLPDMFIPLEFSAAAFRFGHSMIKEKYNLNVRNSVESAASGGAGPAELINLMIFTGRGGMGSTSITPHVRLPSIWIIDWKLFYEIDKSAVNFAERINTILPLTLRQLQPEVRNDPTKLANSLPALDLFRGRRFGLPAGQDVARKIGVGPLSTDEINHLINAKQIDGVEEAEQQRIKRRLQTAFNERTPLWFYVLAEAEICGRGKLGDVGSRIVAETIIQLLYNSEFSILRQEWEADEDFLLGSDGRFSMPDMLRFVRKMGEKYFAELYPDSGDEFDELNPLGLG